MNVITLELTEKDIQQLVMQYQSYLVDHPIVYATHQFRLDQCVITVYQSKKVVFQGKNAALYAKPFQTVSDMPILPQCGSDEVGTGDYFGPVCVCACAIEKRHLALLKECKVQDSKQIKDEDILIIGKRLIEQIPYSLCILDNQKYNMIHPTNNMNAIKAKLHNQCYIHLKNKIGQLPELRVVDQFTPEDSYYRYLKDEKQIIRGIRFETKAENNYLAVACASIIARYAFLKKWEEMEQKYQMTFVKGASSKVDACIVQFVNQYGKDELSSVAKIHFQNTKKALKSV
ncbi:MAG: ribonuclease HIII [Erysipelotrichaceae bacterium]|nr:ribonuclease HIII [Erysipelotrichaceae bacterium]